MIGVYLTIFLIVATIIIWYYAIYDCSSSNREIIERNAKLYNKYPWYILVINILRPLDVLGVLYSIIYFLFFRK